jgi:hypothetical protein
MKKTVIICAIMLSAVLLSALPLTCDGDFITRFALYNDSNENKMGDVDSRLWLGLNAQIAKNLLFRLNLQVGSFRWGDLNDYDDPYGMVKLDAYEAYGDYYMDCIETDFRFGRQYWQSPLSMVNDDSYTGVMFSREDLFGFKSELGWAKVYDDDDLAYDEDYTFLNFKQNATPFGLYGSWYKQSNRANAFSLMPWMDWESNNLNVKAAAFAGLQTYPSPSTAKFGAGAAAKVSLELEPLKLGVDALFSLGDGMRSLSPYYQNGLYIYGINPNHDGRNLYWDTPYDGSGSFEFSAVANAGAQLNEKISVNGALGYLSHQGGEANVTANYSLIPDIMDFSAYTALGIHEGSTPVKLLDGNVVNLLIGTTIHVFW